MSFICAAIALFVGICIGAVFERRWDAPTVADVQRLELANEKLTVEKMELEGLLFSRSGHPQAEEIA